MVALADDIEVGDLVLLTGAGFTHNFGAPLAMGMWSHLLGHRMIQQSARVKALLLAEFDFELAYERVMTEPGFTDEEQVAMRTAFTDALGYIDRSIVRSDTGLQPAQNLGGIEQLVSQFAGRESQLGFVFTLNFDLLLERHYSPLERDTQINLPGVDEGKAWVPPRHDLGPSKQLYRQVAYGTDCLIDLPSRLCYVKLHGSHNWLSHALGGQLVVGTRKTNQIEQEPLLNWYHDLFKAVLRRSRRKLLVFGYGFRDRHINEAILGAVRDSGLKLHVISPDDPEWLLSTLRDMHQTDIWDRGLAGYYQWTFQDLFPGGGPSGGSSEWRHLQWHYFGVEPEAQMWV